MAKFSPGDSVTNLLTKQTGIVCEVMPYSRGRQFYRVRFNDSVESCLEKNLDGFFDTENAFDRVRKGIFGNRDQFALVNTTYKINNSNNNTISSLKASKTIFKAYQFKPLLKFLNSHTRRVLIADEVGLGKTIEAGHILLELKARNEFKTALIICPKSLKIKWQTELQEKFGLTFKIYESLKDAIEDLIAHPQNARGILNYEKIRARRKDKVGDRKKKGEDDSPTNELSEYLQSGQRKYSIILCDEAHKLRNEDTQTYRGASAILDYADSAVFLTATPIMLGEKDLFNLLHLLEPFYYDNKEVFQNLINSNRPFIQAISMLNTNRPLSEIKELLTVSEIVKTTKIGEWEHNETSTVYDTYKGIPLYEQILKLLDTEDTLALRAQLQDNIASMSQINNVFSRTRKREVSTDERQQTERNAHKSLVYLNEDEQWIYDDVIDSYIESKGGVELDMYGEEVLPQGAILGLIQKKRMVASSVYGYKLFTECNCNVEKFEQLVEEQSDLDDAKVNQLVEIINGVQSVGSNKLIVFSIFKFTVRYLAKLLTKRGYKVFAIHGDIKERELVIEQFKAYPGFSILLSTEVGSEGLDMQFCSHLVNYDLPWNPMVVEQRIGRIDRFGQKAPMVHIYNLVVNGSIQEQIYDRLLERIGIFQGVIGDLEMILEENRDEFRNLERDIYGTKLTATEQAKKIQDLAKAIENQKIQLQQVEEGMTNALTNDIYFQNEINKIRNNRLYVTEDELRNYIKMLVNELLKTCSFERVDEFEYAFSVPKSTLKVLSNFLTERQPIGDDFEDLFRSYKNSVVVDFQEMGRRLMTFNQEYAFDNKTVDFVNIYNPIIIAASVYFKDTISSIGNTFQLKYTSAEKLGLKPGEYFMAVYCLRTERNVLGKKVGTETLVPVLYSVAEDLTIEDEELNLKVFGEIQDNAENVTLDDGTANVGETAFLNMEGDFTDYISNYVVAKKSEIEIKDESQKELLIRQLEEYYSARIKKEKSNISEAEMNVEWMRDDKDIARAQNILRLAQNRLKMLEAARDAALERANSNIPPSITHNLISLTRIILN